MPIPLRIRRQAIPCWTADNVEDMAMAVRILIQSLAVDHDAIAAAPATTDRYMAEHDAAALRLEAIHLLLLILQVPVEQVRNPAYDGVSR